MLDGRMSLLNRDSNEDDDARKNTLKKLVGIEFEMPMQATNHQRQV